jgi:hypothetical protein
MAIQEQEHSAALEEVIRQYQELGRLMPQQQAAVDAAATGIPNFSAKIDLAGKAATGFGKAFTDAMGAMYKGEKGLKAFDSAIDSATTGIVALTGLLALVGGPMTLVAAGLAAVTVASAKYVKAANEQSDKLYDAFQQISRSGGAAADGLQGLYNDVQKLGGGIQDLGDFVSLIAENSNGFAQFAGSVFQGRKDFAALSKEMAPYRKALMNAGMSQKDINEGAASYIRLQSRIGQTQNRTVDELAISAKNYLIEQDALTKLTGMTRKDGEAALEAARAQEMFGGKLLQLRNRKQDDAAKKLENTFKVLQNDSKEVGQGFADLASGNLRSEAAQKLERATQGEARRVQEELIAGKITEGEALDRISEALKRTLSVYGESQTVLGNFNSTFGDFAGMQVIANRQLTGGYQRQIDIINQNNKFQGITGKAALDKELETQANLRLSQQNAMQNMQDFVRMGVGPATAATKFFGKVIEKFSSWLPGAGKFSKEYEQEKKNRTELLEKEKAVAEASERVMAAQSKIDSARNDQELETAKKEKTAATLALENAIKTKNNLQKSDQETKAPPARGQVPMRGAPAAAEPAAGGRGSYTRKEAAPAAAPAAPPAAPPPPARMGQFNRMAGASTQPMAAAPAVAAKPLAGSEGPQPTSAVPAAGTPPGQINSPDQSTMAGAAGTGVKPGPVSPELPKRIREIIDASSWRQTILKGDDGGIYKKEGGSPAWKYNNPGNLRATSWTQNQPGWIGVGDAGVSGKFSIFDTLAAGRKAKENLLFGGQTVYGNLNLRDAMYKYAPPQDKNDTPRYLRAVMDATGLPETAMLKDFTQAQRDAMLARIEKSEGFKMGTVERQARYGGVFNGPQSGYSATLHGHEAVIPLKGGNVPVAMPQDFTNSMVQIKTLLDQINTNGSSKSKISSMAEKIKAAVGGAGNTEITQIFDQILSELRRQGTLVEDVLRAQENTVSVSQKILQYNM